MKTTVDYDKTNLIGDLNKKHPGFFDDSFVWKTLKEKTIPELVIKQNIIEYFSKQKNFKKMKLKFPLNILVISDSNNYDAYSIGIILTELGLPYKIDAININKNNINESKKSTYSSNEIINVSSKRLKKNFIIKNEKYIIKQEISKNINFKTQNIIDFLNEKEQQKYGMPAEFKHNAYNIIFCRNVLHNFKKTEVKTLTRIMINRTTINSLLVFGVNDSVPKNPNLSIESPNEKIFYTHAKTITKYNQVRERNHWFAITKPFNKIKQYNNAIVGIGEVGIMYLTYLEKNSKKFNWTEIINNPGKNKKSKNNDILCVGADTNINVLTISLKKTPWFLLNSWPPIRDSLEIMKELLKNSGKELAEFIGLKKIKNLYLIIGKNDAASLIGALNLLNESTKTKKYVIILEEFTRNSKLKNAKKIIQLIKNKANHSITININKLNAENEFFIHNNEESNINYFSNKYNKIYKKIITKIIRDINNKKIDLTGVTNTEIIFQKEKGNNSNKRIIIKEGKKIINLQELKK